MKRKQEVKCPLWMKLTFYQIAVFTASMGTSFGAPMKSGSSLNPMVTRAIVKPITGKVTDSKGDAIPGTTVLLKGKEVGTSTDADGNFSIEVPGNEAILIFSSIGFNTKEVTVGSQSVLNVVLETSAAVLEEVVVTALGIQRDKKALTYATQQIGGAGTEG